MITGLRAIWKSAANKFYIVLFAFLSVISILLILPLSFEYLLLIDVLLLGGVMLLLLLAFLALIPPLWRALEYVQQSTLVKLFLYLASVLGSLVVLRTSRVVADILVFFGFMVWLILLAALACALAHSLSNKISSRSPHAFGWVFLILAVIVEIFLYWLASIQPVIFSLFVFYTLAWFAPCVALALLYYRHPLLFSVYSLIALIYSVFPIAYRLLSLLDELAIKAGGPSSFLQKVPIEEAITFFLFIWALNTLGNFFGQRYRKLKKDYTGEEPRQAEGKEYRISPFLMFGLLFSALAYFAFEHVRGPLRVPQFVEPSLAFIISIVATVPLLFYIVLKKK